MRNYLFLFFLLLQLLSCTNNEKNKNKTVAVKNNSQVKNQAAIDFKSPEIVLKQLKSKKAEIDTLRSKKKLQLEVLVKEPNKEELTVVKNEQWPEEVEKTFNIWKNSEGLVLVIGEFPFSESGDWDIVYLHYFDKNEKVFSFERNTNFFNSICTDGVAYESIVEFYNPKFEKINYQYNLIDESRKILKKEDCVMNYDFPYTVSRTLKEYLEKINYRT